MYLLLGMSPGFYQPVISHVLASLQLGSEWVERVFVGASMAGMVTPLIIGALADMRFSAQRIYGVISILSGCFLILAFYLLGSEASPWWFVVMFFMSKLAGGAMWSLLASLTMSNLGNIKGEFPLVRLGATAGWMSAGWILSYILVADDSVLCGYMAAIVRISGGILAFFLPDTPGRGTPANWKALFGLGAFKLMRNRDQRTYFVCSILLAIPTAAFFMHTPLLLGHLGVERVAAAMSISQVSEVLSILFLVAFLNRFPVKYVLLGTLVIAAARYGFFAVAGWSESAVWVIVGIALHGLTFTLFVIIGQMFLHLCVAAEMRNQAQGLLTLLRSAVGTLVGVVLVRRLNDWALDSGVGWGVYWAILASAILLIALWFGLSYRGLENDT